MEFGKEIAQDLLKNDINPIANDKLNSEITDSGTSIIDSFHKNIVHLREFLNRMDKHENDLFLSNEEAEIDPEGEFANTRSISHLRALLKNYRAVTEA